MTLSRPAVFHGLVLLLNVGALGALAVFSASLLRTTVDLTWLDSPAGVYALTTDAPLPLLHAGQAVVVHRRYCLRGTATVKVDLYQSFVRFGESQPLRVLPLAATLLEPGCPRSADFILVPPPEFPPGEYSSRWDVGYQASAVRFAVARLDPVYFAIVPAPTPKRRAPAPGPTTVIIVPPPKAPDPAPGCRTLLCPPPK